MPQILYTSFIKDGKEIAAHYQYWADLTYVAILNIQALVDSYRKEETNDAVDVLCWLHATFGSGLYMTDRDQANEMGVDPGDFLVDESVVYGTSLEAGEVLIEDRARNACRQLADHVITVNLDDETIDFPVWSIFKTQKEYEEACEENGWPFDKSRLGIVRYDINPEHFGFKDTVRVKGLIEALRSDKYRLLYSNVTGRYYHEN